MAACIHTCRSQTSTNQYSVELKLCQISNSLCRFVKICSSEKASKWVADQISNTSTITPSKGDEDEGEMWLKIQVEAASDVQHEPLLNDYYYSSIFSHNSLESALANLLATKLSNSNLSKNTLLEIFSTIFTEDHEIRRAIRDDLKAARERDPACFSYLHCLLNFKGFQACQSRVSEVFGVDIHPGAKIGSGLLIDHATGVVIGETAVIGDNVSILHNVTLGGKGRVSGDRHPKIGDGVFIGAGTQILGSIRIGQGAKIGAGSVVLKEVLPNTTAVGNPARTIGS
ncbi:hypothetical protein UlMin_017553 [Ulmus minor]